MSAYGSYALTNMLKSQLITNNILNQDILNAFLQTDRTIFLPEKYANSAYIDDNIRITDMAYALNPLNIAKLISLVNIDPRLMVMKIGADLGYASVILAKLFRHVLTVKSSHYFISELQKNIALSNIENIDVFQTNNLYDGCNKFKPYDYIFIFKALNEVPVTLLNQLKEGGKLVMYKIIEKTIQFNPVVLARAHVLTKVGDEYITQTYYDANVPFLYKD